MRGHQLLSMVDDLRKREKEEGPRAYRTCDHCDLEYAAQFVEPVKVSTGIEHWCRRCRADVETEIHYLPIPCTAGCEGGFFYVPQCSHQGNCPCGDREVRCEYCRGTGQEPCGRALCSESAVITTPDAELLCEKHGDEDAAKRRDPWPGCSDHPEAGMNIVDSNPVTHTHVMKCAFDGCDTVRRWPWSTAGKVGAA